MRCFWILWSNATQRVFLFVATAKKSPDVHGVASRDAIESMEKEVLDELIGDISSLVVAAMKNFCSSESILNRACLVLHNLSQNQEHLTTLLWTPHCYQMLEWCIANYPSDQVLRRSAVSTLHRLQIALSNDDQLRARFAESIRVEQELSLQRAAAACTKHTRPLQTLR